MEWNLVVYSCYDQRRGIGEALWRYISEIDAGKTDKAVHAILGTGDQLYNDNVWDTPELKAWLALPEAERLARVPDKALVEAIRRFYLGSYLRHTHFHPAAALLRNTPQINTWDDHDIFDGWGSYPASLQTCPVFQMIFAEAQRAYLLFQQVTNPQVAEADGFLVSTHAPPAGGEIGSPGPGYSFVCQLGPSVAVAVPDTRSQRSRERILKKDVLQRIVQRVMEFPPTVKHLIFVSAVPVAYPSMKALEKLLGKAEQEDSVLHKTGLAKSLNNAFGLPDLLDDVSDHWSSGIHIAEKGELLLSLRQLAEAKRLRITMVSGDVHLCAFTWVASDPPLPQALDPGYMPQIVTSAIGNKPPGDFVVKYLRASVEHNRIVAIAGSQKLRETVAKFFKTEGRGKSSRFLNRMNFCEMGAETSATGVVTLKFALATLNEAEDGVGSLISAVVPPLLSQEQAREADAYELDELKPKAPKFNRRCCALCMML